MPWAFSGEEPRARHGHAADRKQGAQRFAGYAHVGLWVVFTRTDLRDPKQPGIDRAMGERTAAETLSPHCAKVEPCYRYPPVAHNKASEP